MFFIQFHRLLRKRLLIAFVLFFELVHLRLKFRKRLLRRDGLVRQGPQRRLDRDGHNQNDNADVRNQFIEPYENVVDGLIENGLEEFLHTAWDEYNKQVKINQERQNGLSLTIFQTCITIAIYCNIKVYA